ncbi:glycosyltransferase family 8 protein [Pseudanabaena sp. FACHB-1998]|uniref:glycosyltransferase family 8 protein n=1 Tax=Pseudanabaena sp. FACHB-1998 TaxID=2692858 RepID=UPI0016804300|nr:glycosyltransferase family 8 protein [Pseudanabaena sp. FACHB-1998]MBD2178842.1 glycosyltransferase family 8 protein [Pseudanabaena sp. FACHB-1998]
MDFTINITNKNDNIHIAFCIDKNYIQHCAVTITSIFNNTIASNISISIIYSNIDDKSKLKLDSYIRKFTSDVKFILINEKRLKRFPVSDHITLASYYRIFLADLLDSEIKKVVFLDCDLIVRKDIVELWSIDVSNYSHAAAIENGVDIAHKDSIGIKENFHYFNAGVMLINLEYWRSNSVAEKAVEYINKNTNKIQLWDQDVLNFILQSQWLVINSTWNATWIVFMSSAWTNYNFTTLKCQELKDISLDPSIIHFTGSEKPWHSYYEHPYKDEYYNYLNKTPWQKFRPINRPNLLAKFLIRIKKIMSWFNNIL